MRIHFILTEDYVFHAVFLEEMIKAFPGEVIGVSILHDTPGKEGLRGQLRHFLDIYGVWGMALLGGQRVMLRLLDRVGLGYRGYRCSLKSAAKAHGILSFEPGRVNAGEHLAALRRIEPDIIVSSCGQIFKQELLALPRIACINRHTSLLPQYRGVTPVIHMLAHGETQLGVTIHTMELAIDAGRIVAQRAFAVTARDTLYSTYCKGFQASIAAAREAIELLRGRQVDSFRLNPVDEGKYFGTPHAAEGRAMRRNHRVVTLRDILGRYA